MFLLFQITHDTVYGTLVNFCLQIHPFHATANWIHSFWFQIFRIFRYLVLYLSNHFSKLCSDYKNKSSNLAKTMRKLRIFVLRQCQRMNRKSPPCRNVLFSHCTGISIIQWRNYLRQKRKTDFSRTIWTNLIYVWRKWSHENTILSWVKESNRTNILISL